MRVVLVSDGETVGGAATAASRLAEGLIGAGCTVARLVFYPDGKRHHWETCNFGGSALRQRSWQAMQRVTRRIELGLALASQRAAVHRELAHHLERLRPQAINLHNIHGAALWPSLVDVCSAFAPTIWTLHDMWTFTGRCAYSHECRKFTGGCDASCPTPNEYPDLNPRLIAGSWELRKSLLEQKPALTAVAPSQWLAGEALTGLWRGHRVEVIPNGLPLDVYHPIEKQAARAALGLDMSVTGPVLMMCGQDLALPRKGGALLQAALQRVAPRHLTVLTVGKGNLTLELPGIRQVDLGYLDEDSRIALAYSAADVFVHPAVADNLPNVVAEALACGTPVAALRVGGLPEMVSDGVTGWLASSVDAAGLAAALNRALTDTAHGVDFGPACRSQAEELYGVETQAGRYYDLFQELCGSHTQRAASVA